MSNKVLNNLKANLDKFKEILQIQENKRVTFFLVALVVYSIFCRISPPAFIAFTFVVFSVAIVSFYFYLYVLANHKIENKNEKTLEYSWGYIKEQTSNFDFVTFTKYLKGKDFIFYKNFVFLYKERIILLAFIFGDMVVAFKNLSFFYSGTFFAMSIITKFVFLGYMYMSKTYKKVDTTLPEKDEKVLDIFYSQINGLVSVFFVLFILFFLLSKYIVEIFFGENFISVQSSLPFILLANMFLCIALCVYETAKVMDRKLTNNILKIYASFFVLIFIFMPINYIDTVTYFIVGSSSLVSIFLYNFVIKKPEYIQSTYNHLF